MKKQMLLLTVLTILVLTVFCGCSAAAANTRQSAAQPENTRSAVETAPSSAITREQAQAIALEHAGFTADQVRYLRTEYEVDDGIAQYEVSFHEGRWEYDYEINAETGAIISFEKDD